MNTFSLSVGDGYEEINAQLGKEGWKAESALERTFQVRAICIKVSYTKCIIMNVIHINIHHFVHHADESNSGKLYVLVCMLS